MWHEWPPEHKGCYIMHRTEAGILVNEFLAINNITRDQIIQMSSDGDKIHLLLEIPDGQIIQEVDTKKYYETK